jgi:hypothetical protein
VSRKRALRPRLGATRRCRARDRRCLSCPRSPDAGGTAWHGPTRDRAARDAAPCACAPKLGLLPRRSCGTALERALGSSNRPNPGLQYTYGRPTLTPHPKRGRHNRWRRRSASQWPGNGSGLATRTLASRRTVCGKVGHGPMAGTWQVQPSGPSASPSPPAWQRATSRTAARDDGTEDTRLKL